MATAFPSPSRPGIMIVNPRLHDPTPETADMFLRWTKLHNRDLLDMDVEGCEGITRAMRFNRNDGDPKYGHITSTESAYFYTLLTPAISTFQSTPYYALPRRLDIENTRALQADEEPVGCEEGMMVWDVVDARFAIFYQVELPGVASYQTRTSPIAVGNSYLVGVGITGVDEGKARELCEGLTARLRKGEGRMYVGLYKNAGVEAQPKMHQGIGRDGVGGCEWLVLVLLDDVKGVVDGRGDVEGLVGEWIEGLGMRGEEGVEMRFGVWMGELDMS